MHVEYTQHIKKNARVKRVIRMHAEHTQQIKKNARVKRVVRTHVEHTQQIKKSHANGPPDEPSHPSAEARLSQQGHARSPPRTRCYAV